MKPDWKDAPEWANWLAMDQSGVYYWYETKPKYVGSIGIWEITKRGKASMAMSAKDTLEERP